MSDLTEQSTPKMRRELPGLKTDPASVRQRIVAYYEERLAPRVFTSWRDRAAAAKA